MLPGRDGMQLCQGPAWIQQRADHHDHRARGGSGPPARPGSGHNELVMLVHLGMKTSLSSQVVDIYVLSLLNEYIL